jgi:aerobic carbon-monoxide dehydrogenase small subunit
MGPGDGRERIGVMSERVKIVLTVNGTRVEREVEPRLLLADFLREHLRLVGTHLGCEHGVCGACTIRVDGDSVRSCLMFAVQADGSEITTVEGLGELRALHPIQSAFHEHHGLQCGFCTPGMMITALDLIEKCPLESEDEVREGLSGNLCRCTGYQNIVTAVVEAAKTMRGGKAA